MVQLHSSNMASLRLPFLFFIHFIQATLAWAFSLHESKLLWLTHFFRAALVWYSILAPQYTRYTLVAHNSVTVALLHLLFSSTRFACVVRGICTSSSCLLCFLHVLCHVFHLSSLLSLMGSFAPSLSHIPFMPCIHCLDFSHSALPVSFGIFVSPSFHFLCISYAICCMFPLSFSFPLMFFFPVHLHTLLFLHSMLCILCALCCTSCHSSFLLLWGIPASPYFHILCISCGYLHMHHYSTTASASKPLNLSFLHVPLSFFQLSLSIPTFNFLLSVLCHQSLPL